jgi:hypothetical protein
MAGWHVISMSQGHRSFVSNIDVGHEFVVRILLQYVPNSNATFVESPKLDWTEAITFVDHRAGTFWRFRGDLFKRKPTAATFDAWLGRYYHAYNQATGAAAIAPARGRVELRTVANIPIRNLPLPAAHTDAEKARHVREYIARTGCRLYVEVVDRPALAREPTPPAWSSTHQYFPPNATQLVTVAKPPQVIRHEMDGLSKRRERLLVFDVGLAGHSHRIAASQHLLVDAFLQSSGRQDFYPYNVPDILTNGFTKNETAMPSHLTDITDWQRLTDGKFL